MNPDSPSPVASQSKNAVAPSRRESLIAWACGVGLGILPLVFVWLTARNAKIIHDNHDAEALLEIFLFLGAGFLLFFKRGSHNARLTVEVTIWVATANILTLKYTDAPLSYVLVVLAILAALGVAYKRGETR